MFTSLKESLKKRRIDYIIVQEVFVKLGLFFVTGGTIGFVLEKKIDAVTALIAIILGMVFIWYGSLRVPKKKEVKHDIPE